MTNFDINEGSATDEALETNAIVSQIHGGKAPEAAGGEFDLSVATASKRPLPLQAIAVGVVLVVAAGSLFLMRREGTRAGIDFNTTTVVTAEHATIKKMDNEDEILKALATTGPPDQVPKEMVPDGPFRINKFGEAPVETGTRPGIDPARIAAERRRVQIQETLGKLQVESVMHGRIPIAKISGRLVRAGDMVGEIFTVDRIENRSVFLTVDENEYELSMVR